jgi:ribosomal protein S18 acetylase RimI-like enzyme
MLQDKIKNNSIDLKLIGKIIDLSVESFVDDDYYVHLSADTEVRKKTLEQIFLRALYLTFKYGTLYLQTDANSEPVGCLSILRWNELRRNKFDYDILFNPPEYKQGCNNHIEKFMDGINSQNLLYILYVAVQKGQRRKGIASGLIRNVEELITPDTVIVSDIYGDADKESMKLAEFLGANIFRLGKSSIVFKQP